MGADLVGRERVDVGDRLANQPLGEPVELFVVVRGVEFAPAPVEPQPPHIVLDRIDVLDVLLDRVGVVEAEVADATEIGGDPEVDADGLGVADVQVAIGLGRKPRDHAAAVLAGRDIRAHDLPKEVLRRRLDLDIHVWHTSELFSVSQTARPTKQPRRREGHERATSCVLRTLRSSWFLFLSPPRRARRPGTRGRSAGSSLGA